ncbi:hypothetical protein CDL12_18456 [Handroanthus impetiginosus]|uniref:Putative plant transposon protein domain-containing protein n=1 Tax=Handroanthus impetiginosus TaxID=429701 RepID=A0A2G9GUK9_9LAMI|nr:hypothetical protein CDL12_18456 [Handroanthus impetiginosus]
MPSRTINFLFGTSSVNTPGELQEFLADHPPLDTVCELICRDDPQWTLSRLNEPIHFSCTKLTIAADHWLRFVSARLLLTTYTSEVTKERVVMIFAILTDVPFDIGQFLHKSIWKSVMGGLSVCLYHPSLITALCARTGLERHPGDELLQTDSMIVDRLADEGHQLRLRQEQQFAHQQQWWALWADQMNVSISNRLHYPSDELADPPSVNMENE